tara:strand:- start:2548 stop:2715 length:168 start_codon:yes stop_codon:yes gene_type:complete
MLLELENDEVGLLEHVLWVYSNQPLNDAIKADNAETIRLKVLALSNLHEEGSSHG